MLSFSFPPCALNPRVCFSAEDEVIAREVRNRVAPLLGHIKGFKEYLGNELDLDKSRSDTINRFFDSLETHLISVSGSTASETGASTTSRRQGFRQREVPGHRSRDLDDEFMLLKDSYDGMRDEVAKALASRYLENGVKADLRGAMSAIERTISTIESAIAKTADSEEPDAAAFEATDKAMSEFKKLHKQVRVAVRKEQNEASLFLAIALGKYVRAKVERKRELARS
jgi:hypothetical protein